MPNEVHAGGSVDEADGAPGHCPGGGGRDAGHLPLGRQQLTFPAHEVFVHQELVELGVAEGDVLGQVVRLEFI